MPKIKTTKKKTFSPSFSPIPVPKVIATLEYDFRGSLGGSPASWLFDMGPATKNPSTNPAPVTSSCLYIIYNDNENTTYVGYAGDANHRWTTRTEVFHCFGVGTNYAKKIHCAICQPELQLHSKDITLDSADSLKGAQKAEHLLMRAVVNGELGATTSTNTQDSTTKFLLNYSFVKTIRKKQAAFNEKLEVKVFLPTAMTNGNLRSWQFQVGCNSGY